MKLFPGRTLEELDRIDYPRLLRALDAQTVQHVERERERYLKDRVKGEDWDPDVAAGIAEHEQLLEEHHGQDR